MDNSITIGLIFSSILILGFLFVVALGKGDRPGKNKAKSLGMNPDNTFGIRSRPERMRKLARNRYALVEILDDGNVRFYLPPHKELFTAPKSFILAFGINKGLFGQIQLYLEPNYINNPETFIPIYDMLSGVVITPGAVLFNNRSELNAQIQSLSSKHNIPIVPLQYPSDLKYTFAQRIVVAIIVGYFIIYPLFTNQV